MSKKIVEYHVSRLQHKNPDVRLQAIQELELLGDVEALEALQSIFNNDPDEKVRQAAQQAGREIFRQSRLKSSDQ